MGETTSLTFAGRALVAAAVLIAGGGTVAYAWALSERFPPGNFHIFIFAAPMLALTGAVVALAAWVLSRLGIPLRTGGSVAAGNVMVPYFDPGVGRIVQIPAAELRSGTVQVQLCLTDEDPGQLVWMLPEHLTASEIQHPPFDDELRGSIEQIQRAFAEHRPISLEEWEEGFRRDREPMQEIALWLRAAHIYQGFCRYDPSPERRAEAYRCICACLTTDSDSVWRVFRPQHLTPGEAREIVQSYFASPE